MRRGGYHDDLMDGFEIGSRIGNSFLQAMNARKEEERQSRRDNLQDALLQMNNPGLQISQTHDVDGQKAMTALPVDPGTEDDNVQPLADGVLYDPQEKIRLQDSMDQRRRSNRMSDLKDELTLRSSMKDVPPVAVTDGTNTQWVKTGDDIPDGYYLVGHPPVAGKTPHLERDAAGNPFTYDGSGAMVPVATPQGWQSASTGGSAGLADHRTYQDAMTSVRSYQKLLDDHTLDDSTREQYLQGLDASQQAASKMALKSGLVDPQIMKGVQQRSAARQAAAAQAAVPKPGMWDKVKSYFSGGDNAIPEPDQAGAVSAPQNDADSIRSAFRSGQISRDEARKRLQAIGLGQ